MTFTAKFKPDDSCFPSYFPEKGDLEVWVYGLNWAVFDLDGVMQYERGAQTTEQYPMSTIVSFPALDGYSSWVCIDLSSNIDFSNESYFAVLFSGAVYDNKRWF